jgi:NAD(P)-dependent dehydrogenase (short-subunit alcohol dehydrogenase family)
MAGQLAGQVALVTGGSSGIGRATALAFAREGAQVVVADVNVAGGEETVRRIRAVGGEAIFVKTDVTQPSEVEAMVNKAVQSYGRLDCAFNNAGVATRDSAPTAICSEDDWDRVVSVNLKGVFLCLKYELRQMLKQGGGAIVNTASVYGLVAAGDSERGISPYVASKHGVVGQTKATALEYAHANIRINAVCPGHIRTPMIIPEAGLSPKKGAHLNAEYPVGRIGEPEEVAQVVVWLCSEAASFITGHALVVDGGRVAAF